MPFTFSHPAIVLTLTYLPRKWISLTGLVIGSLTPDFEYFIRMRIESKYSHTIEGLFWFDLPIGFILALIFHSIVKQNLFDNIPMFLKSRVAIYAQFDWNEYLKRNWLVVIISILIGAASHLFWDSFTHEKGYFVQSIFRLQNTVVFSNLQIPIFKIIQHFSTLLGGLIIALKIYKLPKINPFKHSIDLNYWLKVVSLTLVITALRFLFGFDPKQYGSVIVTFISANIISLIIAPVLNKGYGQQRR